VWAWDLLLCGFFAAVSRPPPVASFSLCDLRLFVMKRIVSLVKRPPTQRNVIEQSIADFPGDAVILKHGVLRF